jgi:hypothetical protein
MFDQQLLIETGRCAVGRFRHTIEHRQQHGAVRARGLLARIARREEAIGVLVVLPAVDADRAIEHEELLVAGQRVQRRTRPTGRIPDDRRRAAVDIVMAQHLRVDIGVERTMASG